IRRLLDGHGEHVGDGAAAVADRERLLREAPPATRLAVHPDVGQEAHLNAQPALAGAGVAPPARDVEREPPGAVAAQARLGHHGEQAPDVVEEADVGGRRRARRPPDGALVHLDGAGQVFDAGEGAVGSDAARVEAEGTSHTRIDDVAHQRRLPGAGDAGHTGPGPERYADIDALQVVLAGAVNR